MVGKEAHHIDTPNPSIAIIHVYDFCYKRQASMSRCQESSSRSPNPARRSRNQHAFTIYVPCPISHNVLRVDPHYIALFIRMISQS
jgi:hypothetical protein